MLASPWPAPFSNEGWLFEPKWDGIRAILTRDGDRPMIHTRRGTEVGARYPELSGVALAERLVLDGEIVALDEVGNPSFERLQRRIHRAGGPRSGEPSVSFVAFDLLWLNGESLIGLALEERLRRLGALPLEHPFVRAEPVRGDGVGLWEAITARDLEGMVAKRLGSIYRPGIRSADWRKIPHLHTARVVVGGYTPGSGGRSRTFGSLLLGLWEGRRLRWVGAVGSGLGDADLVAVRRALDEMRREDSPFHPDPDMPSPAAWVEPALVAAVRFRNWTAAGRLRHPVFQGFTNDDPERATWEAEGP